MANILVPQLKHTNPKLLIGLESSLANGEQSHGLGDIDVDAVHRVDALRMSSRIGDRVGFLFLCALGLDASQTDSAHDDLKEQPSSPRRFILAIHGIDPIHL